MSPSKAATDNRYFTSEYKIPHYNIELYRFTKSNVKKLQEAMYHSTENGNIEITLDLRNFGWPSSL